MVRATLADGTPSVLKLVVPGPAITPATRSRFSSSPRAEVASGSSDKIKDVELVDLPTGHWPQFTRPAHLATALLAAVDR